MRRKNFTGLIFLIILFCTNYDNPFLDPSNAQIFIVKDRTSFDTSVTKSVLIFSTETLTVTATVPEQFSWFFIKVTNNRLPDFDTVYNPTADDYPCYFSFYDTGDQYIDIYAMRLNGDLLNQKYKLHARNPLNQADLGKHDFEDTIQLYTDSVRDPVVYNWQFGSNGVIFSSPSNKLKAVVPFVNSFQNRGILYISDKNHTSPADSFAFTFFDSTPPQIVCLNSLYDEKTRTVTATDSVFYLNILATDRGNNPVQSLFFDNLPADYINNNTFTKIYRNMQEFTTGKPLQVTVHAVDNVEFNNSANKTFFLTYDKNAAAQNSSILSIVLNDSVTSSRNTYLIFGTVSNTTKQALTIESEINGTYLGKKTFLNGTGEWSWNLELRPGLNIFNVFATDTNGTKLDSSSLAIIYRQDAPDTIAPRIYAFTANGIPGKNGIIYSDKDSVDIYIRAFDQESGIRTVHINSDSLFDSSGFEWHKKYYFVNHYAIKTFILSITDYKGNSIKDSLSVGYNHVPYIKSPPAFPYLMVTGKQYLDTLLAIDEDHDRVYFQTIHLPANMSINKNGRLYFQPDIKNVGIDSIVLRLTDSIKYSEPYVWTFRITDPASEKSRVQFSSKQQFPSFIEAGDSLKVSLAVDSSTGNPPYFYTAIVSSLNRILTKKSPLSLIGWKPQISDTGEQIITCMVEDTIYKQADTLTKVIKVVRPNSDPCSLSLPEGLHNNETLYLQSNTDTVHLDFKILDDDDPVTEEHTVTIRYNNNTTRFKADSLSFSITLSPPNSPADTLHILVTDNTRGNPGYKVSIPVILVTDTIRTLLFLSDINDLAIWNPAGNFFNINGLSWEAAFGTNVSFNNFEPTTTPTIPPKGLNNFSTLSFSKTQVLYSSDNNVLPLDTEFSIFAVVKYLSENAYDHRVILSSATNFGYTGFGVDRYGHPEVINKFQNTVYSSKITASADPETWFVVSYRSSGIGNNLLSVTTGLNSSFEAVSINNAQSGSQILLGAGSRTFTTNGGWKGEIAEIAVYQRKLSDSETKAVIQYFLKKFALQ